MSRTTYKHIRHKEKSSHFFKRNIVNHWIIYLIFIILLIGILSGVLYSSKVTGQNLKNLDFLFNIHSLSTTQKTAANIFTESFSSAFIMLFLIFVFGFCVFGLPVILYLVFVQGFGFGLSAGYIYSTIGTKGVFYNISVLIPCMALLFFVLLYASKNAMIMSISLFKTIFFTGKDDKPLFGISEYFIKYIVFMLLLFIKALIETISVLLFSGFLK